MWLENLLSEGEHSTRLRNDLIYFAEHCLKLRTKSGAVEPFILNPAQRKLHDLIEDQKRKTGKVRAVILKSRQLGISTYTAARFFHRCINSPGLRCFILGHTRQASSNLFQIVRRFYDHLPEEIKPKVGTSNAEELLFSQLDSGYLVSVATSEGTGRSATAQLLHGSEVAFWDDLDQQMAGLLQVVPDIAGSEIFLESTACGFNSFHSLWRKAQSGESEFQSIFLPWQLDTNYRRELPKDFKMEPEETKLAELHNLEPEQICWRRAKINELGNSELFPQEYPASAEEAFVTSSFDSFISPALVLAARREKVDAYGPVVLGVDPAHLGPDRTSIAWRQGRCIKKVESRRGLDTMQTCGWITSIMQSEKIGKVCIDITGIGAGIHDRLLELGHRSVVEGVNFAGKPVTPPPLDETGKPGGGPANRRSEMWLNLKKALEAGRFQIPDSDSIQADLTSVGYRYTSEGKLLLESKVDLRRRGVPSPDEADAIALTFAQPDGFLRNANFNQDLRRRYGGAYC